MNCLRLLPGFVVAGLLALAPATVLSQAAWPNKPIRFIVGFPPGGPTDVIARIIADRLKEELKQPVLVENRPGASGNVGAQAVAASAPDGYTFLYSSTAIATSPALYDKLPFDALRDFEPVTQTISVPLVLVVNPSVPAKTVSEFISHVRANPGKLNYASSGAGTSIHLVTALFLLQNTLDAQHVPYKGTNPALADLVGGTVQFTTGALNTALPFIRDGRLRPLAVTSLARSGAIPQVPTLDESGMKGFEVTAWQAILAPAKTPADILQRISAETARVMRQPEVLAKLATQDALPVGSTPGEYAAYLRSELERWKNVVRVTGARAE